MKYVAVLITGALMLALPSVAGSHCVGRMCDRGHALAVVKAFVVKECKKHNTIFPPHKCYRTSNGRRGDPTRLYGAHKHYYDWYGTYVYGHRRGWGCWLTRMWGTISKHNEYINIVTRKTTRHEC